MGGRISGAVIAIKTDRLEVVIRRSGRRKAWFQQHVRVRVLSPLTEAGQDAYYAEKELFFKKRSILKCITTRRSENETSTLLYIIIHLEQGCTPSVLEGHCPAEFSSNPNQINLNKLINVFRFNGFDQGWSSTMQDSGPPGQKVPIPDVEKVFLASK